MNPQLTRWTGPEGLPRFDLIHDTDFAPAFDQALAAAEAEARGEELPSDEIVPGIKDPFKR